MSRIRFAIVGAGWRAAFYVRIAKQLPDVFEITGMLVRSEEKVAAVREKYGIPVYRTMEELLAAQPDFVVVAVKRADNAVIALDLLRRGVPVLAETPAADALEDMQEMWRLHKNGAKVQVAEQYFLYPGYEAKLNIAKSGCLGKLNNLTLSAIHEYHGISILRLALQEGLSNVSITARTFEWPVTRTQNRDFERVTTGESAPAKRVRAEFVFEDGKVGFYDFDGTQYHSHIRGRTFDLQGERGELFNDRVCYLDEENRPLCETLTPMRGGDFPGIETITFAGKAIYRNPFAINTLNEDETAIARLLVGMKAYIDGGEEIYPLADALQDAYLTTLLKKALETDETVTSESQIWVE